MEKKKPWNILDGLNHKRFELIYVRFFPCNPHSDWEEKEIEKYTTTSSFAVYHAIIE